MDLNDQIATATGLSEPIAFRVEGEPVDVAEAAPDTLTVASAVQRALTHSPEVQAALARLHIAQADATQARLLPNPILSVVIRWPTDGGTPEIEAGLAAELVSLLTRPGRISAADHRLRAAAAAALSQVLDVLADTQAAYTSVQVNDELVAAIEERVAIVDRLLTIAQSRLEVGEGTQLDVLALQTRRAELDAERTELDLERRSARLSLARLIGQPSGAVDWRVSPWTAPLAPALPEATWVALGLDHRPDVLQQRYTLAALGAESKQNRWAPLDGAEVGAEAERADGEWAVGPALATPVPLFDFGQGRRQRAQAAVIEARHALTQVQRQVVEETRQALATYEASRQNLQRVRAQLLPLAQRRREQAESQFRAGQTDITEMLLAEEQLQSARTRLVELERRSTEALIRLHRAVGGPGIVASAGPTTAPTTSPPLSD